MAQSNTTVTHPSPSTTLTIETSLSALYKVLRTVIKPVRPHLVKPGKPLPAGSPQLTSHPKSKNGVTITERKQDNLWLYDFTPKSAAKSHDSKHQILYFAGGGFQSPPSSEHWGIVSKLAASLHSEYQFTLVSYPLAPNSPASSSLPILQSYLRSVCEQALSHSSHVSLMGDSAGGNVALSLAFWWSEELARSDTTHDLGSALTPLAEVPPPTHLKGVLRNVLAISPACDLRSSNPAISEVDKHDPLLGHAMEQQCATAWVGPHDHPNLKHIPRSDPLVSPVCYSFDAFVRLKKSGIRVHGVIATHDVLGPDADVLRKRCVEADIPGEWLMWEGQMHCFVLAGVYGMAEGKRGIEWCERVLRTNV